MTRAGRALRWGLGIVLVLGAAAAAPLASRTVAPAWLPVAVAAPAATPEARGLQAIRAEEILADVRALTAPEMAGRAVGSPGIERAAGYLADAFRRIGLRPGGEAGGYLQPFEVVTGVRLAASNRLVVTWAPPGPGRAEFPVEQAFIPFAYSESGRAAGELVFAGYGITAPELQYDDYARLDVRGRIVLVLTHEPQERNQQGPFRAPSAYRYTENRYKVLNAREHGAAAILIVADPLNHQGEPERLLPLREASPGATAGILAVQIRRSAAEALLSRAGRSLLALQQEIDAAMRPRSLVVPETRVDLEVALIRERGRTANVVGILPGTDPTLRDTALVIGGHYDHLGLGGEASLAPSQYREVHPGADDNASGVAGVLALARAFVAAGGARRTLIFVAFSGEELGLLGSSHFVRAPPVAISRVVAMFNLDMVGRLRHDNLYVQGVDTGAGLRDLVQEANQQVGLTLRSSGDGYGPSDHTAFYLKERPVLFFFTGPHQDYHRPSDTADKINAPGEARVVSLAYLLASRLANRSEAVAFVKPATAPPFAGVGGGYGAYFGSIPDFGESETAGVRLSGVRGGSPAERAGLKPGDIIVGFGGMAVKNLYDLTYALRTRRAGDEVEVVFLREGHEVRARAVLGSRQ
ncbi:MAG: M28 family peptidase [Deltaproteobacteria bacterium]|nr:M28 family peptidase [Deltaproteobacteria bacterium]